MPGERERERGGGEGEKERERGRGGERERGYLKLNIGDLLKKATVPM